MNLLQLKKWKSLIMVCIGALALCACGSDEEEWELIETSISMGSNNLDAFGEKKVIKIETNSSWEISTTSGDYWNPSDVNWITFDKTSGIGNAEVVATIAKYESGYSRNADIVIKTGGLEKPVNNVAGSETMTYRLYQNSVDDLVRNSLRIDISNMYARENYDSNIGKYIISGNIDYEITYNTEDKRVIDIINGMITSVDIKLYFGSFRTADPDIIETYSIPFEIGKSSYSPSFTTSSGWYTRFNASINIKLNDGTSIYKTESVNIR